MATLTGRRPQTRPTKPTGNPAARAAKGTLFHAGGIILAVAFMFPLLWALLNSFKSKAEANEGPPTWFPHSLSVANYRSLASFDQGIGVYLRNSIVLSLLTVIGSVIVCVLGGYGFARFRFRGKTLLFGATLAILMVPYATILLPLYIVLGHLNLQNSLIGLALVLVMFQLPFGIYLMRNSFESVPRELEEAALVDGAAPTQTFRHVLLPQLGPVIALLCVLRFIFTFNKFDDVYLLTGGGAGTEVVSVRVYDFLTARKDVGLAAAQAIVLAIVLVGLILIYLRAQSRADKAAGR